MSKRDVQRIAQQNAAHDAGVRADDDATTAAPSAPNRQHRDERSGRFLPGNLAAIQHALHTDNLPPAFAHLRGDVDAFINGCVADEADADDLPTRRRALLEYRGRVHRRILQLDAALEVRGVLDKRGKLRAAWLQRLEGLIRTALQLDSTLGLARRAHDVTDLSALDYVRMQTSARDTKPDAEG